MKRSRTPYSSLKVEILAEQAELVEEAKTWRRFSGQGQSLFHPSHISDRMIFESSSTLGALKMTATAPAYEQSTREWSNLGNTCANTKLSPTLSRSWIRTNSRSPPQNTASMIKDCLPEGHGMISHSVPLLSQPGKLFAQLRAGRQRRQQKASAIQTTDGSGQAKANLWRIGTVKAGVTKSLVTREGQQNCQQGQEHAVCQLGAQNLPSGVAIRQPGSLGLAWCYSTRSTANASLKDAEIRLFDKPLTFYQPMRQQYFHMDERPVFLEQNNGEIRSQPLIKLVNHIISIFAHYPPWPDIRSDPRHPDFLPESKLAAYQASEVAGYRVWRHDRDLSICRKAECRKQLSDFSPTTRVCIGCGPKSIVRYCCHAHEVEDLWSHGKVCGKDGLVRRSVIDHSTAPDYFASMCPAITLRGPHKCPEQHRQRHFAAQTHGHYTLFDDSSRQHTTFAWPKSYPEWREMDSRIERLLNIALFRPKKADILKYLYTLLRYLVSIAPPTCHNTLQALKTQFGQEFSSFVFAEADAQPIFPCECIWLGRDIAEAMHLKNCKLKCLPLEEKHNGIRREMTKLESQYWILRSWAQQHPTVACWRKRAEGEGYEGIRKKEIRLGPGFVGWGAKRCNMFD